MQTQTTVRVDTVASPQSRVCRSVRTLAKGGLFAQGAAVGAREPLEHTLSMEEVLALQVDERVAAAHVGLQQAAD